mgnify:FL=1
MIIDHLRNGAPRKRTGLRLEGRAPAREGAAIVDSEGRQIGTVTSGGFGPSLNVAIAMGYVEAAFTDPDTSVNLMVRGKALAAKVTKLPFVQQRYYKP